MIDLTLAKQHLRVDTTDEDVLIQAYITGASGTVQKTTGKLFAPKPMTQKLAGFPRHHSAPGAHGYGLYSGVIRPRPIRLWYGPVYAASAGVSIAYDDADGVEQQLTDFRLVDGSAPLLLPAYGSSWPVAQAEPGSVRIGYTAGYSDADGTPPDLDQAVLLLIGHYYQNREAVTGTEVRATPTEMPLGVDELLEPYRIPGIG